MELRWAVMTAQLEFTRNEHDYGDKEWDAQAIVEMVMNKAGSGKWLYCEAIQPIKRERDYEDWVAEVAVLHR